MTHIMIALPDADAQSRRRSLGRKVNVGDVKNHGGEYAVHLTSHKDTVGSGFKTIDRPQQQRQRSRHL